MATWRLKYVGRPTLHDTATGESVDAMYLRAHAVSDEDQEVVMTLDFAEHSGLQAEFEAGLVTTVLEAAVSSVLDDATTPDSVLPPGTKGGKDLYEYEP